MKNIVILSLIAVVLLQTNVFGQSIINRQVYPDTITSVEATVPSDLTKHL